MFRRMMHLVTLLLCVGLGAQPASVSASGELPGVTGFRLWSPCRRPRGCITSTHGGDHASPRAIAGCIRVLCSIAYQCRVVVMGCREVYVHSKEEVMRWVIFAMLPLGADRSLLAS